MGAALHIVAAYAGEPKLPAGVICEDVRAKVAEYGRVAAYAWARLQRYKKREIAEAPRCLLYYSVKEPCRRFEARFFGGEHGSNNPVGDNARKGAMKRRSQIKTTLDGATAFTKPARHPANFIAVKKIRDDESRREI